MYKIDEAREARINDLYFNLFCIGIRVSSRSPKFNDPDIDTSNIDIEETIIDSLYYIDYDGRLLGVLFSWLHVHHKMINPDKFFKTYKKKNQKAPWMSGICSYLVNEIRDHRFKDGVVKLEKEHHAWCSDQSLLVQFKGGVEFLKVVNIIMATSSLRIRKSDAFYRSELAHWNRQYRNRLLMGPIYRADIFTKMENGEKSPEVIAESLDLPLDEVADIMSDLNAYLNPNPPYID